MEGTPSLSQTVSLLLMNGLSCEASFLLHQGFPSTMAQLVVALDYRQLPFAAEFVCCFLPLLTPSLPAAAALRRTILWHFWSESEDVEFYVWMLGRVGRAFDYEEASLFLAILAAKVRQAIAGGDNFLLYSQNPLLAILVLVELMSTSPDSRSPPSNPRHPL